jgi:signal transduction histidine kinase
MFYKGQTDEIRELIRILLDNAIKFSHRNGIINITTTKEKKDIVFSIYDQGIGIDKKDIKKIFDRFYKSDPSRTKDNHDGFGLGLSIAKRIIDKYQGQILVKSEVNKGSEFIVKLPLHL